MRMLSHKKSSYSATNHKFYHIKGDKKSNTIGKNCVKIRMTSL